jgi:calcium/calmodulin-dependent protein kinase kinase 2
VPSRQRNETNEFQEHPWVTKNGTDPLLSEAENTVDLVVPTDAEMNHAITSTMTNLMTVVCLSETYSSLPTKPPADQSSTEIQRASGAP